MNSSMLYGQILGGTIPGSMESFSEHTQTRTFKNHANLLAYLANWPLFSLENGFQGAIKRQGSPFLGFAQVSLHLLFEKLPERAPNKTQLRVLSMIDQLHEWACPRSTYAQLSPLYPSLHPNVTHVVNYSRPSPAFLYCKRRKAGRGLGTRLLSSVITVIYSIITYGSISKPILVTTSRDVASDYTCCSKFNHFDSEWWLATIWCKVGALITLH